MFLLKKVLFPFCFSLIAFAREKSSEFGALLKSVKVSESEILLLVEIFLSEKNRRLILFFQQSEVLIDSGLIRPRVVLASIYDTCLSHLQLLCRKLV